MPRDTKEALRRIEDALLELEEPEAEEESAEDTEEAIEDTEEEGYFDYPEPEYDPPQRSGISCLAAFALMLMGGILIMLMLFWLKIQGIVD